MHKGLETWKRNASLEDTDCNSLTCRRVVRTKCGNSWGPGWVAGQSKQGV